MSSYLSRDLHRGDLLLHSAIHQALFYLAAQIKDVWDKRLIKKKSLYSYNNLSQWLSSRGIKLMISPNLPDPWCNNCISVQPSCWSQLLSLDPRRNAWFKVFRGGMQTPWVLKKNIDVDCGFSSTTRHLLSKGWLLFRNTTDDSYQKSKQMNKPVETVQSYTAGMEMNGVATVG